MALFFVDYDLRKHRDYSRLTSELEKLGAVRLLESSWCFRRENTNSVGIRDHLKQFIDSDDGLCVSEVTDWATWKTLSNPNKLA
jgi:hypothetical protein